MNITPEILSQLNEIIGDSYVFTDQETRNHYGKDETEAFDLSCTSTFCTPVRAQVSSWSTFFLLSPTHFVSVSVPTCH